MILNGKEYNSLELAANMLAKMVPGQSRNQLYTLMSALSQREKSVRNNVEKIQGHLARIEHSLRDGTLNPKGEILGDGTALDISVALYSEDLKHLEDHLRMIFRYGG